MTDEEKIEIKKLFPFIGHIKDDGIREKVIEVWVRVWKQSGYLTIEEALMTGPPEDTLAKHINAVTNAAFTLASQYQQEYGLPVDLDILLAGALLHDVDKMIIYKKKGNTVEVSDIGKRIPHGSYGGYVALEVGLPLEVVHMIITHSSACTWKPTSIEDIFLHYADFAKIRAVQFALGWKIPPNNW